jgi:hypothetical protein
MLNLIHLSKFICQGHLGSLVIIPDLHSSTCPNILVCVPHMHEFHYVWYPVFYISLFFINSLIFVEHLLRAKQSSGYWLFKSVHYFL